MEKKKADKNNKRKRQRRIQSETDRAIAEARPVPGKAWEAL